MSASVEMKKKRRRRRKESEVFLFRSTFSPTSSRLADVVRRKKKRNQSLRVPLPLSPFSTTRSQIPKLKQATEAVKMARQGSKLSGGRRERRRRKKDGFISNSNRRRPYLFLSRVRALARLLLAANFSRLEMREKGETSAESVERRRGWFVGEGGEEEAPRNYFFFFSRSFVCSQRPRKFESKRVSFFFFFLVRPSLLSLPLSLHPLSTLSLIFPNDRNRSSLVLRSHF